MLIIMDSMLRYQVDLLLFKHGVAEWGIVDDAMKYNKYYGFMF